MPLVLLGPSILTANFHHLADEIAAAETAGVDFIHLDIMDGSFVPNITFGPLIVESMRALTQLPLEVHLMIEHPERHLQAFVAAGANTVTIHVETSAHLHAALTEIRALGASPGVALNPATPLESAFEVLPFVDQVLIMSVNPGYGGQTFIPASLGRIERMRDRIQGDNPGCRLEVDGGIKPSNIGRVVDAGAEMIVAGSAIYSPGIAVADAVRQLREGVSA
ncbi:ribulose-phosphate 3-epimerase [soil metagenome]